MGRARAFLGVVKLQRQPHRVSARLHHHSLQQADLAARLQRLAHHRALVLQPCVLVLLVPHLLLLPLQPRGQPLHALRKRRGAVVAASWEHLWCNGMRYGTARPRLVRRMYCAWAPGGTLSRAFGAYGTQQAGTRAQCVQ